SIIVCFYRVYSGLRHGYREHIYALALERELAEAGHRVDREVAVMVYYRGRPLARQKLDMIVDGKIVIEIKGTAHLPPDATAQLFSYLCATDLELGLLLHFGREPRFYRVLCENRLKDAQR
ncbi:MAG: GxxExxY protein, partial [Gemmatimonadaceae bacterium]